MIENDYQSAYSDFWKWFKENSNEFKKIIKDRKDVEEKFFDLLAEKLLSIKKGFCFLVGVLPDGCIDLIFTAEGDASKIIFIEELVDSAPKIKGWRFSASKPAVKIDDFKIDMGGYVFGESNIGFYVNEHEDYPDLIDLVFVHNDLTEENLDQISHGICIFLDNYIGEISFLNNIDSLNFISPDHAKGDIIPVKKLQDYLIWRQKEFVEKYDDSCYNDISENFVLFKSETDDGYPLLYTINVDLLKWDTKASHPWVGILSLKYDKKRDNELPTKDQNTILEKIEDKLIENLKSHNGNLYIGRQTGLEVRSILFACKDFRICAKEFDKIQKLYSNQFEITIDIYKDKYWQSFEMFTQE